MKVLLLSALLCIASVQGASFRRLARDAGGVIPTLVEEILKTELQSDLKQNSAVEAFETEPLVKEIVKDEIKEEIIVDPLASRTVLDGAVQLEEKKPEIVEIVEIAVKEESPEPILAVLKSEPLPEISEKVETVAIQETPVETPVDSIRTEPLLVAEQPLEIVKEIISEIRQEPEVVEIKIEEMSRPSLRNVIKEEIVQVEELRNTLVDEREAIKEVLPEPVASSQLIEPVPQVKEDPLVAEIIPEKMAILEEKLAVLEEKMALTEEKKEEDLTSIKSIPSEPSVLLLAEPSVTSFLTEIKEEIKEPTPVVSETIVEIKKLAEKTEAVAPIAPETPKLEVTEGEKAEIAPETRQSPTIVENIQNALANVPLLSNIVRPATPAAAAPALSDAPADDATVVEEAAVAPAATTPTPNILQQIVQGTQQAFANTQQAFQNALNPTANAANTEEGVATPNGPFSGAVQFIQTQAQNLQNLIRPNTPASATPAKEGVQKPEEVKPVKEEVEKPIKEDAPMNFNDVKKEVAEEKNNLVKNGNWMSFNFCDY